MEASNTIDINPQVLSSLFIVLVVCLVIASFFVFTIKKCIIPPFLRGAVKPSLKGSLLDVAPPPHSSRGAEKSSQLLSLVPALCCAFMLYSSITAIVDSHGDPATVFFVVSSLGILALLHLSMHKFERAVADKDDAKRDRLKMFIWLLAMLLNILFSYRVTSVLQSPLMTGMIWGIAAVTSLVGCYLLFSLPQKSTADTGKH